MRFTLSSVAALAALVTLAACGGRSIIDNNGNGEGGTSGGGGTTGGGGSTGGGGGGGSTGGGGGGTVTPTSTTTAPPPPPPVPDNPTGKIEGDVTGDPGCPKNLADYQSSCTKGGMLCDVALKGNCEGEKLRYMCVTYSKESSGYWVEALNPSLNCGCPKAEPVNGSVCERPIYGTCDYKDDRCPSYYGSDGGTSYYCGNYYDAGPSRWQGYSNCGYWGGYYDAGPYPMETAMDAGAPRQ